MSKIIQLSPELSNQIAAGEVVERPVSIIKELVENALDAGASFLNIEIKNGGKTFIKVGDDGEGFSPKDLEKALDKHATSKIKNIQDLYNILTFGFRGEALSSISSVSKITISTKRPLDTQGLELKYNTVDGKNISPIPWDQGTEIIVEDLFFNTPARLNYLKTDKTEYQKIVEYLQNVLFIYPEVGMRFICDGRTVWNFASNEDLSSRIFTLYGEDFLQNTLKISTQNAGISVSGVITSPKIFFGNRTKMHLFVNKRPISSPLIYKAISDAYNRFIPPKNYPGYILSLEVDPQVVDVNVHPRKQEVRFANESQIFSSIYHSVYNALEQSSLVHTNIGEDIGEKIPPNIPVKKESFSQTPTYYTGSGTKFKEYSPYKDTTPNPHQSHIGDAISFSKILLEQTRGGSGKNELSDFSSDIYQTKLGKIIGQVFQSYIIVEGEKKLIIFDQHALSERILYEKLIRNEAKNSLQKLLIPEHISLSLQEIEILNQYGEILSEIGFEIEILSHNMIGVGAIPDFIKKENLKEILGGILEDITQGNTLKFKTLQEVKNKIFAYSACRGAIKFGNKLSIFEMNKLLNDAVEGYSSTCPHGRPVVFELSLDDLKDKYER